MWRLCEASGTRCTTTTLAAHTPPLYVRDADTDVDAGADAEGFAATARKIAGAHVFRV